MWGPRQHMDHALPDADWREQFREMCICPGACVCVCEWGGGRSHHALLCSWARCCVFTSTLPVPTPSFSSSFLSFIHFPSTSSSTSSSVNFAPFFVPSILVLWLRAAVVYFVDLLPWFPFLKLHSRSPPPPLLSSSLGLCFLPRSSLWCFSAAWPLLGEDDSYCYPC